MKVDDGSGAPAEDEEWENIKSDIDDDEVESTDSESDRGECGGDKEDGLDLLVSDGVCTHSPTT